MSGCACDRTSDTVGEKFLGMKEYVVCNIPKVVRVKSRRNVV